MYTLISNILKVQHLEDSMQASYTAPYSEIVVLVSERNDYCVNPRYKTNVKFH